MLYKMTRDRFNRLIRHTFKTEMAKGNIIQTDGTAVFVNGLLMGTKALSEKLGIDVRNVMLVDKDERLSNIDMWKDYIRRKL